MLKVLFILLGLTATAQATVPVDGVVAKCQPYPSIQSYANPISFKNTNNLVQADPSGFYDAEGEKIKIFGRVMDVNCVPVGDAKIYIWQANAKGYLQYPHKNARKPKWLDPNFVGTGILNSNNMGRFDFITIKPGACTHATPHIDIMVVHPDFKTLKSKIYFPQKVGDRIHDSQPILNSNKATQVSALPVDEAHTYVIDITLKGVVKNKEY